MQSLDSLMQFRFLDLVPWWLGMMHRSDWWPRGAHRHCRGSESVRCARAAALTGSGMARGDHRCVGRFRGSVFTL